MKVYKVKSQGHCNHVEEVPPITMVFIDERGCYRHGKLGCEEPLEYLGTSKVSRDTEGYFYCLKCKEGIYLPLTRLPGVVRLGSPSRSGEVRLGDRGGDRPHHSLARLLSVGDRVPLQGDDAGLRGRVEVKKHEVPSGKCSLCGVAHYLPPVASTR